MSIADVVLRDARRRAGVSQRELARRAGVSQSTVARIERGRMDPTVGALERLLEACGVEMRVRLAEIDPHDRPRPVIDFAGRMHELTDLARVAAAIGPE